MSHWADTGGHNPLGVETIPLSDEISTSILYTDRWRYCEPSEDDPLDISACQMSYCILDTLNHLRLTIPYLSSWEALRQEWM